MFRQYNIKFNKLKLVSDKLVDNIQDILSYPSYLDLYDKDYNIILKDKQVYLQKNNHNIFIDSDTDLSKYPGFAFTHNGKDPSNNYFYYMTYLYVNDKNINLTKYFDGDRPSYHQCINLLTTSKNDNIIETIGFGYTVFYNRTTNRKIVFSSGSYFRDLSKYKYNLFMIDLFREDIIKVCKDKGLVDDIIWIDIDSYIKQDKDFDVVQTRSRTKPPLYNFYTYDKLMNKNDRIL